MVGPAAHNFAVRVNAHRTALLEREYRAVLVEILRRAEQPGFEWTGESIREFIRSKRAEIEATYGDEK